ncbi:helix-turn-helix transcriptional regulator [Sphingomonas jatrophae]|uniref:DNA-binding transcriptional regulator, CsgD family n=1 Tax=Sphingomonas jatrophae TaxID=1166337 RepID=A0A1I6LIH0_9SPHN|nr:LuxR C-terminal-related transcriptional regulator [Sphingomonas jatrophae]SFS03183.1 DNA-binding transcriptional regulator, CsgD family [Sphingomonas jatrophae]
MATDEIARLAHLFAQAAVNADGWLPALSALSAATASAHGELLFLDRRTQAPFGWWFTDVEAINLDRFREAGGYDPRANMRIATTGRPMQIVHERHYDLVQPLLTEGEALRDVWLESRVESGCQVVLLDDPDLLVGLAVLRGGRDGRTCEADRALFAAVAPFVRDAATISIGMERQGAQLMAGAFESVAAAAFLLDGMGRLMARTSAAEALLRDGRLLVIDGRLVAPAGGAMAFARAIAQRLRPEPGLPPPLATVALESMAGLLVADVSALPRGVWSYGATPSVLVVVRGGALRRDGAAARLRAAWDLSPAEAEVALALADGRSRAEIAAARGVSLETVRSQLKTLFGKAGVTREAELAARAAALIGAA